MIWIGTDKGVFSYDGYSVQPHFSYGERSNSRIYCGMTVGENYLYLEMCIRDRVNPRYIPKPMGKPMVQRIAITPIKSSIIANLKNE